MDALLASFVAVLLAEIGGKPMLLARRLGQQFATPGAVAVGLVAAAVLGFAIAAAAGAGVAALVPYRATRLLTGLALIFAGGTALMTPRDPRVVAYPRLGAVAASGLAMTVLLFGESAQFLAFALAASSGSPVLAAAGASAGALAAWLPALLLGERLGRALPIDALRVGAAVLLLIAGVAVALAALRLV